MSGQAVVKWTATKASAAGDALRGAVSVGLPNFHAWNVFALGLVGLAFAVATWFGILTQFLLAVGIMVAATGAAIRALGRRPARTYGESPEQQAARSAYTRAALADEHRLYGHQWIYGADGRQCPHCGLTEPAASPLPRTPARVTSAVATDLPREITATRSREYVIDVEIVPDQEVA